MSFTKKLLSVFRSETSKDTAILFVGNSVSAILGFLFVYILTKYLTVEDFGVFSAVANLVVIISSISDFGITTGILNFVSRYESSGNRIEGQKYLKAAFIIRLSVTSLIVLLIFIYSKFVSRNFLASDNYFVSYWVGIITLGILSWYTFPSALIAYKKFVRSVILDWSLGFPRIVYFLVLAIFFVPNLNLALVTYSLSTILPIFIGIKTIGSDFLKVKIDRGYFQKLTKFTGWLGVNSIASSISARLDIQMLAYFSSATLVAQYSVASRLSLFVIILCSSVGVVLSTRLARFNNAKKERAYIAKSILFVMPIVLGVLIWSLFANEFILILFGDKYQLAGRALKYALLATIPFILSTPAVTAIIHSIRKPIYIGIFSLIQLPITFFLNKYFIKFDPLIGASITLFLTSVILLFYSWIITIFHYWGKDQK